MDEIAAADPPAEDKRGPHFSFLETKDEPDLIAPLTGGPAFGLAENLAGRGTLDVPWQVQLALNIPPYSHRPGRPTSTPRTPSRPPARSAARSRCWPERRIRPDTAVLYFRITNADHASHRNEFLQDARLDYEPIRSRP